MELVLDRVVSCHASSRMLVELPSYMTCLDADEIQEIMESDDVSARERLIVAAGRCPSTGDVTFVTADGYISEFSTENMNLPTGEIRPIDHGQTIAIFSGSMSQYEIAADWAVENSVTLVNLSSLNSTEGMKIVFSDEDS